MKKRTMVGQIFCKPPGLVYVVITDIKESGAIEGQGIRYQPGKKPIVDPLCWVSFTAREWSRILNEKVYVHNSMCNVMKMMML